MRYDHAFRERGYHSAFLTTYAFDPVGFDNVTLTDLKNSGCRNIAVLADADMLNQSIMDVGSPRFAGQSYHLAKRRMKAAFHPKIVLQLGQRQGRLMIGSANLTTAGMVGNVEAFSQIFCTEEDRSTAGLFAYLLEYFERHSDPNDLAMRRALSRAKKQTRWLRNVQSVPVVPVENGQRVGVLTDTESAAIAEQFVAEIGDDRIHRLICVAPFADVDLWGLQKLQASLGNPQIDLIPDLAEQDFTPETAATIENLTLRSPEKLGVNDARGLHAKLVVALGAASDYILTGSMNASTAGLYGKGSFGGNAEAAIFRTLPSGASMEELGETFAQCLGSVFPVERFNQRQRGRGDTSPLKCRPLDGGSFELKRALLRWRPAVHADKALSVMLYDASGSELVSLEADIVHEQWGEIDSAIAAELRTGRVLFEDGSKSVETPVTAIEQIDRSSQPPQSRRTQILLDQMKGARDIRDIFSMLDQIGVLNHDAMVSSKKARYRASGEKKDYQEETGEHLSPEEFGETNADTADSQFETSELATLEELRRAINRQASVYMSRLHDPDAELSENNLNLTSDEENSEMDGGGAQVDQADDPNGEQRQDEPSPPDQSVAKPTRLPNPDDSEKFYRDILRREKGLRDCLDVGDEKEMPLDQCLLFQVIVLTVMIASSTGKPTEQHPIEPLSKKPIGWIPLLARFLIAHMQAWQDQKLLKSDLTDNQKETLGLMAATSVMLVRAMGDYDADPNMIARPFLKAAQHFDSALEKHLRSDPEKAAEFDVIVRDQLQSDEFRRLQFGELLQGAE